MENLQKIAEAVHAAFVAESIKALESEAHAGKFTSTIYGEFEELRALGNELRRNGYWYDINHGSKLSVLSTQWHSAP